MSYDMEKCPKCFKEYDPLGMSTLPKLKDGKCPRCGFDIAKLDRELKMGKDKIARQRRVVR